ncbi:DUF6065 family protein [Humitalea sp. 24SJ18S-53]|uniref:DUF6065 family protein n=1 Tax=Humitalea sp. 24SJ18S-53 TaxID=3422307 RepID=UPI003D66E627
MPRDRATPAASARLVAYDLGHPMPAIRPASPRRDWMEASPQRFANRCLPLTMANAHGWEIAGGVGFDAWWTGGDQPGDVVIRRHDPDTAGSPLPVAHFGAGVLTFHIDTLFRTDPGVALWVSGPPNAIRDGIAPLSGLVETDWAPMTFTMNWRFTRPHAVVTFKPGEPVCWLMPIDRDRLGATLPEVRPLADDPALEAAHNAWRESRSTFNAGLKTHGSPEAEAGWQRDYHRGRCPMTGALAAGHLTRPAARPFKVRPAACPAPEARPPAD